MRSLSRQTLTVCLAIALGSEAALAGNEIRYRIDRGEPGRLVSFEMTYLVALGGASAFRVLSQGREIPVRMDSRRRFGIFTTDATSFEIRLAGDGAERAGAGGLSVAPLWDDRKWAWSHGFDDNVNFKRKGIPAFEAKGWQGTLFLIGKAVPKGKGENYILGAEDLRDLAKRGWGIGNHGWLHQGFRQLGGAERAAKDAARCQALLAEAAGRPPISYAAPMNDSSFGKLSRAFREAKGVAPPRLIECGNQVPMRVDPGHFSPGKKLGRRDTSSFRQVKREIVKLAKSCGEDRRLWYNTLAHGCDEDYPNGPLYRLVEWVYDTYGPGGTNEVWVAPSERVYSYLCLRDSIRIEVLGR